MTGLALAPVAPRISAGDLGLGEGHLNGTKLRQA